MKIISNYEFHRGPDLMIFQYGVVLSCYYLIEKMGMTQTKPFVSMFCCIDNRRSNLIVEDIGHRRKQHAL